MKNLIGILLLVSSGAAFAAEAPAKEVACRACHGEGGAKPIAPNYPKLKGQNQAYLEASMKAYRAGDRKGGLAMIMTPQATSLTDEEITAFAKYYAEYSGK